MNLCVIPARGGSKRIPRKNIREFCGRPMIAYAIDAAFASGLFDQIMVSTDDDEIADIATLAGATVPFRRPADLSDDHASTTDVICHALNWGMEQAWTIEAACCVYATAAFVTAQDLCDAHAMISPDCDFVFPAVRFGHPPQRGFVDQGGGSPAFIQPEYRSTRTQDLPPVFHDPGQFYWGKSTAWLNKEPFFGPRTKFIEIPEWHAVDIDRPEDWVRAEALFTLMKEGQE